MIHNLLGPLEDVRQTGSHKYRARCPVHGGRSLVITEKDNAILFHCFGGCSNDDVLARLGLSWSDILPNDRDFVPRPQAYPELETDFFVIEIWQAARRKHKQPSDADMDRYKLALKRTDAALRKRPAPYSKRLQDPEHVYLWYGLGCWERAAEMPAESLVLPPFADPHDFNWPVENRAVSLVDCGKCPAVYAVRIERHFGAIAALLVTDQGAIYER